MLGGFSAVAFGAVVAGAVVVYQMALIATTDQSLGKRWLGIDIVRMNGRPPGFVSGVPLRVVVPQMINLLLASVLSGGVAGALGGASRMPHRR